MGVDTTVAEMPSSRDHLGPLLLTAAGRGLLWGLGLGVVFRAWMRLLSTRPEFTWSGTLTIVGFVTVLTVSTSLAAAVRADSGSRRLRAGTRLLAGASILGVLQGLGGVAAPTVVLGGLALGRDRWPRWLRVALGVAAVAGVGLLPVLFRDDLVTLGVARSAAALAVYLGLLAVFTRLFTVSVASPGSRWAPWPSLGGRRLRADVPPAADAPASLSPSVHD